ncbi:N-acetyl-gamma-glutamyl-phosphate reductase [Tengunoibacter tsumagoiensis]|uniref:N-acetyl-gamma-glutamyl-phosphate reductase n=1 Tax=Tengunoibacter tsumagoiensis TaxID=2014871 RepID=A0A402A0V7_9CHLR|nr:N-acetyl-gamma-glutamyl-phosphate reductase [Tengunoibacter tsumagoiensis]GCE12715.1 N-acetyl-gamma-glutamyl-phosphate reductase [Tengunoibacter tsumagoiensis]
MTTVSIVNVTGYTGLELLRLLAQHPEFVVTSVTGRSAVGQRLLDVFPQVQTLSSPGAGPRPMPIDPALAITEEPAQTELAFVCLPHAAAAESVVRLLERGIKVVDLSADFRLHDAKVYEEWYAHTHPAPALLESSIYGLPERYREQIRTASLVANPGCNATTTILGLLPIYAAGLAEREVITDVKAALSGAGRGLKLASLYAEANEDVTAYSVTGHRHLPEVTQEVVLAAQAGGHALEQPLRMTFFTHLVPMTRGIFVTSYIELKTDAHLTTEDVQDLYRKYYADEPFVHVVKQPPHTRWTYGSNHCFIYPIIDQRTNRLIVMSCLDNMGKGASGQAIQNANLMYGLPETTGLFPLGVNP